MEKQTFATVASPQAKGDEPSILISSIALDRDSDVLVPEGVDVAAYMKNPVVGIGHFRGEGALLPIGSTTRIDVEAGRGIRAAWRWLENDAVAARVRNAWEQGVLRAASVGFLPLEWTDIRETGGRRYTRWQLLEWSLVPIPANPQSVRALKTLGLWDDDDRLELPDLGPLDSELVLDVADDALAWAKQVAAKRAMNTAYLSDMSQPTFDIDPEDLRAVLVDAVGSAMREMVRETVKRALNQSRGRVD